MKTLNISTSFGQDKTTLYLGFSAMLTDEYTLIYIAYQLQTRLNESIPATDYNIICINYIQQQFRLKNHRMLAQQQALDFVCCDFCGPLPDLYRTII